VGWANGNGIVAGAGGNFTPNAPITRQDMAVLLTRYADKADKSPFLKADVALTFSDKGQIAPYAADAVKSLQQAGILAGKENHQFNPTDNASRAEAAKVMALYLKSLVK